MKQAEFGNSGTNLDELMRSAKAGRIAHALLFSGPRGTGKKTAARLVTQAALCTGDGAPCGVCPACKQALSGTHPDVHVIAGDARSISVDEIRDLREKLALRPFAGARHVAMICQADRMTAQAQNALLKTLEEPVGDSLFLLLTDQPGAMLDTIVSRCRRVRFGPLRVEDCARVLTQRGIEPAKARLLSACAQGCVGRALELSEDEGYFDLREKTLASLRELAGGRRRVASAVAKIGDGIKKPEAVLEILEVAARDRMMAENGGVPYGECATERLSGSALLQGVLEIRRRIASNVSFAGALEELYLELADSN